MPPDSGRSRANRADESSSRCRAAFATVLAWWHTVAGSPTIRSRATRAFRSRRPRLTLIDLATRLGRESLETAVNKADALELVDPETLRACLADHRGRRGVARLRVILDRRTFVLTDSQLERRFLPLARQAGLDRPVTRARINGFRVDFHWPDLRLVVETDGLRYHRTPAQQTRDRIRDQAHAAAGLTCLRFTHGQVRFEPNHVVATLKAVAARVE